jgi:2',3'-cyclic-nucleotide 2'-phosphodiesterase (5'-nucleotidase family)
VAQQRAEADHLLLLDTGDALVGGGILGDLTQGEVVVAAMNQVGYDAMALGPKELQLGLDVLRQRMAEAEFAIVSANAVDRSTGERLAVPYVILPMGHYRVAVVGVTRHMPEPAPGIDILPAAEAAREAVAAAAAEADVVVLLTNVKFKTARAWLPELPDVDLLVAALPGQLPVTAVRAPGVNALAVTAEQPMARHSGRRVGRLKVTLGPDGLGQERWTSVSMGPSIPDDEAMRLLLLRYRP